MSREESLNRAIGVFAKLAKSQTVGQMHSLAQGLALAAEGLEAKLQGIDRRLDAIEAALRRPPSR